jgi:ribulose-phosphate 3-epimerase
MTAPNTASNTGNGVKLAPSVLSADFSRLGEQVAEVARAGADFIHVDIMDGHFVPNITMGPVVVEGIRAATNLPLNVHLMIENPDRFISDFIKAGADHIIVHSESSLHLHRLIHQVKDEGIQAGIAINPSTPLSAIEEVLTYVDIALVGTVNPGFAGQRMIPETLDKASRLDRLIKDRGYGAEIELDGGINAETAPDAVRAGATILVAGSAVFNRNESVEDAMRRLRESIRGAGGAPRYAV